MNRSLIVGGEAAKAIDSSGMFHTEIIKCLSELSLVVLSLNK